MSIENKKIKEAIEIVGSQDGLAKLCNVSQASVHKWLKGKALIKPENVHAVVIATNGKIKAHELRPDLPHLFPEQ